MTKLVAVSGGPIEFHATTRDYTLKVRDTHWVDLFYCPFCGRPTPRQTEPPAIAEVGSDEKARLLTLIEDCTSRDEIIQRLGAPDFENIRINQIDPIWNEAVKIDPAILYTKLSAVANLRVVFLDDSSVSHAVIEPKANAVSGS
jgi:hypothetical protein